MEEQLKQQDVVEVTAPVKKSTWLPKYRDTRKTKAHTKALVYDSDVCPPKADAKKILAARGIKNAHVLDCVYGLLLQAAEQTGIIPNRFLFANGVIQTLKSYEAKVAQPLTSVPDEPVVGELILRSELHALYDASIAWREELSFDEFLQIRHICKTDCFLLGRDVLGKDSPSVIGTGRISFHDSIPTHYRRTIPRDRQSNGSHRRVTPKTSSCLPAETRSSPLGRTSGSCHWCSACQISASYW